MTIPAFVGGFAEIVGLCAKLSKYGINRLITHRSAVKYKYHELTSGNGFTENILYEQ